MAAQAASAQIDQLWVSFNQMGNTQKRQFIENLKGQLANSKNTQYTALLRECISVYNAEIRAMNAGETVPTPSADDSMPSFSDTQKTKRISLSAVNAYIAKVFGWMFLGLLVTALTTLGLIYGLYAGGAIASFVAFLIQIIYVIMIFELVLVFCLSRWITSMRPGLAKFLYLVFAVTNGLTFGLVALFAAYFLGDGLYTLGMAFGITALTFGIMAIYGLVTKTDLTRIGNLLFMGLIGLIIVSVANIFLGSSMLEFIICIVGLFIFLGLTAFDTNRLKNQFAEIALSRDAYQLYGARSQKALASNLAIIGALGLYLNFINILWFILKLFLRD